MQETNPEISCLPDALKKRNTETEQRRADAIFFGGYKVEQDQSGTAHLSKWGHNQRSLTLGADKHRSDF